jgi:hypothetical protein
MAALPFAPSTQQQVAAITQLVALGFAWADALRAYQQCGFDVEAAVEMLQSEAARRGQG